MLNTILPSFTSRNSNTRQTFGSLPSPSTKYIYVWFKLRHLFIYWIKSEHKTRLREIAQVEIKKLIALEFPEMSFYLDLNSDSDLDSDWERGINMFNYGFTF